jgi:hypothetical protein
MITTVTPIAPSHTTAVTLFVAFELSEKTWKLAFTTAHGHQPRERTVTARQQEGVLDEIAQAKRRLGLPETAPVLVATKRGAKGFGCIGFCSRTESSTMWWILLPLKSAGASVGLRAMGWTCTSC